MHRLGGPAVIIGQSISGGAATIAAATAPELVSGVIELAPFTRKQPVDLGGLLRVKRFRVGYTQLGMTMFMGSMKAWKKYLDLAYPTKPADWDRELARIEAKLGEPGRMKALQAMCQADPGDAGEQLPNVACPVLVIEGSADPDWADPRAEGEKIVADLPAGRGELVVLDGVGHYPHAQTPDRVIADSGQKIHAMRTLRSALHGFATLEVAGGFRIGTDVEDSFTWMIDFIYQGLRSTPGLPLIATTRRSTASTARPNSPRRQRPRGI